MFSKVVQITLLMTNESRVTLAYDYPLVYGNPCIELLISSVSLGGKCTAKVTLHGWVTLISRLLVQIG